jgi:hypothetical protein
MTFVTRNFAALLPVALSLACAAGTNLNPAPGHTSPAITSADTKARMYAIADDSMKGREAGAAGNFMMTTYLAHEAARFGLEPGGENGTWFQTIPMIRRFVDSSSTMSVNGQPLTLFTDYAPVRPSTSLRTGTVLNLTNVQAVYGGRAGDSISVTTDAEAKGRVVVLDAPLGANGKPTGTYATPLALSVSRYPSAAAVVVASLDLVTSAAANSLRSRGAGLAGEKSGLTRPMAIVVTSSAAERMLGAPLPSLTPGARGANVSARIQFREQAPDAPARNVIAILRGSDPALRGEYVAIGAHNDHLGMLARPVDHDSVKAYNQVMRYGVATVTAPPTPAQWQAIRALLDSLRKVHPARIDSVYNGADDDGSGSVALLEIAESLAAGKRPRRSIIMVWHTAEESGLLGSAWFTDHTTVPHDSIVAQLNMDMVGRGTIRDLPTGGPRDIQVIGSRRLSTDLGDVLDSVNSARPTPYAIDYSFDAPRHPENRYCRSDHYMYARTGIPIAYVSRGHHPDYHQVTDEAQYIDFDGLANVASFVHDVAVAVADRNDRVRVDKPKPDPFAPCRQ